MTFVNATEVLGSGINRQKRDCSIIALSVFFEKPYEEVEKTMTLLGKRKNCGIPHALFCAYLDRLGLKITQRPPFRLWSFLLSHPSGRFIVWTRGHIFTVIDGKPIDTWEVPANSEIVAFWSVA